MALRKQHTNGRHQLPRGRFLSAVVLSWMVAGASEAAPAPRVRSVAEAKVSAAWSALQRQEFEPASELLKQAIKAADDSDQATEAIARTFLGMIDLTLGRVEPGLRAFDQGLALAEGGDDALTTWFIELIRALALQQLDRSDEALAGVGHAQEAVDRLAAGQGSFSLTVLRLLGADSLPPVVWDQAEQMAVFFRPMLGQALGGMTLVLRAELEAARGDEASALASLEASRSIPDPFGLFGGQLALARARVLRLLGHDARAVHEEKLAAEAGPTSSGSLTSMFTDLFGGLGEPAELAVKQPAPDRAPISRARLLGRLGRFLALRRSDEAMVSFDQALSLAEGVPSSDLVAETLDLAARGAFALEQATRAIELQERYLDLALGLGWPCRHARGLLDLAAMLAWAGDAAGARRRADEGRAEAEGLGLGTLNEEAQARLSLLDNAAQYPAAVREELLVAVEGPGPKADWPSDIEIDLLSSLLAAIDGDHEKARKLLDRTVRRVTETGAVARRPAVHKAREILAANENVGTASDGSAGDVSSAEIPDADLDHLLDQLETTASRQFLAVCETAER